MKSTKKPIVSSVVLAALPILMIAFSAPAMTQTFTEWSAPVNLGSHVNGARFDGGPFISTDGLSLFITSNRDASLNGPNDIYVSHRASRDLPWGEPVSLGPDINTPNFAEGFPFLTRDGRYLYFNSDRPGGCGSNDIYVSRRLDESFTSWTIPKNLGCLVNSTGVELAPSFFEDDYGALYLYFSSGLRPGGLGFGDIYFSTIQIDGTFGPASPVSEFNTPFNDIRPTIRATDGLEMYFDSNRTGSMANSSDLYVSERACSTKECPWTIPVNLGPPLNSTSIEGGAKLSSDGTELYFMSNRPGGFGDQDIYMSQRTKLN